MNKRILFYYKLFFSGGTEHSILKLIKKLYQNFDIIVAYDEEESTDDVLKKIAKYAEVVNLNKIDFITVDKCIICYHPRQETFAKFGKKVRAEHYYFWGHILLFETYPIAINTPDTSTSLIILSFFIKTLETFPLPFISITSDS